MAKRKELTCLPSKCILYNPKGEQVGIIPFEEYVNNYEMMLYDNIYYIKNVMHDEVVSVEGIPINDDGNVASIVEQVLRVRNKVV